MNRWASTIPLAEMSTEALELRLVLMTLVALDGKTRADADDRSAAAQETADEFNRRVQAAE